VTQYTNIGAHAAANHAALTATAAAPSFENASTSVAIPTEGAAPNMPANALGLNSSPSTANPETIAPPRTKRIARSPITAAQIVHHVCQSAIRSEGRWHR